MCIRDRYRLMEIIADLAEKLMLAAWYAQYDFGVPRYGIDVYKRQR